jgi:hypothetical protein
MKAGMPRPGEAIRIHQFQAECLQQLAADGATLAATTTSSASAAASTSAAAAACVAIVATSFT